MHGISELDDLLVSGLDLDDVVNNIRGSLVPPGHEPHPFKNRRVTATQIEINCRYVRTIGQWHEASDGRSLTHLLRFR